MFLIILILVALAVSTVLYAIFFQISVIVFKKGRLAQPALLVVAAISKISASLSLVVDRLRPNNDDFLSAVAQLFLLLIFFTIPYLFVKKTLRATRIVSIGIVGVAFIFNAVAGTATALAVRSYVIQAFVTPSSGMSPALLPGDHLIANKFIYRFRAPARGELVVFRYLGSSVKNGSTLI